MSIFTVVLDTLGQEQRTVLPTYTQALNFYLNKINNDPEVFSAQLWIDSRIMKTWERKENKSNGRL